MINIQTHAIPEALSKFANNAPLLAGAEELLRVLGYSSRRTVDVGSIEDFIERFAPNNQLTERQGKLFESWSTVEIVFQLTDAEISNQNDLFETANFDEGRIKSFLFLTVDMLERVYTRTFLAETTRAINRLFAMPVILLFRHGSTLTLAVTHRRAHKLNEYRDVLERVTLIKDIRVGAPHRAHIDILSDLSLKQLIKSGVDSFDMLHEKWEQSLDIELLNKRFYLDIFAWFEWAVESCNFPDDGAGEGGAERHVIRLITRLLFIWFLKEKHLVSEDLFEDEFACSALKNHSLDSTDYYRAILQNLFFATLNTEIESRSFRYENEPLDHNFKEFRYRELLTDPHAFVKKLETVPFVNGGLFDCLDDFASPGSDGKLVDAFTEKQIQGNNLNVPARLFLDSEDGLFALFRRYKFTIEESTPLDREVALDPELLGRVFENLLAAYNPETRETARKETGSYYTPRPVVDYMVREALIEALLGKITPPDEEIDWWWRDRLQYLLDHSNAMDDANDFFKESERRTVVAAIAEIRTLDPAVGSGAFPMGILQTLTLALRRLDPNNTLWEEIQKERAKVRAGEAFDTQDQYLRDDELSEISTTFEKYRESDFGRKLYLIQNGIYGVDIQPIACQIAKLRFFISLVIEQEPDPHKPNLGIKPLPNLETRLVAADSLLDLQSQTDDLLQQDTVALMLRKITAIRERYFLADSWSRKLECVELDKCLRRNLREILEIERQSWIAAEERDIESAAERFPNMATRETFRENKLRKLAVQKRNFDRAFNDARMIAGWDPFDQNAHANWFNAQYMFNVSDGFDVVIGNPPYIQLQKNGGHAGNLYQGAGYETFVRSGDIYQLFYERGCGLLKLGTGTLVFITSNSWLKAKYGRLLRQYFANQHTPLSLVEMGRNVFENAIVDTAVLSVRRGKTRPVTCRAVDIEQTSYTEFPPPSEDWGTLQPEGELPWMSLSSVERTVIEKMEAVGKPLKLWDISIYYGIKTGYNKAFIVDTTVRDKLINEDPNSEEILKPILRGRDIARYHANWVGLWLISTLPSLDIDIDNYPAIKRHLLSFGKERLAQDGCRLPGGRRSRAKTSYAWYELQTTCAFHEKFGDTKLLWRDMSDVGCFAYSNEEIYTNDKAFLMTGPFLKYLCAILNSSIISWYVSKTGLTTGMGLTQWKKYVVESIPVPPPGHLEQQFIDVVDLILQDCHVNYRDAERELDQLTFSLYGLTQNEQRKILNET